MTRPSVLPVGANNNMTMKRIYQYFSVCVLAALAITTTACSDECDYLDTNTSNPSFGENYPASLTGTKWVRGNGMKYNVFGEEIQGFVESMDFYLVDSVIVKMSEGCTAGTWTDDSNTAKLPTYKYSYSPTTGAVKVSKSVKDDKGKVSDVELFAASVDSISAQKFVMTVVHYGDTPAQTYLVKQ